MGEESIPNNDPLRTEMLDSTVEIDLFQCTIAAVMRLKPDARKLWFSKVRSRISP